MRIFKAYKLFDGFPANWNSNALPVLEYSLEKALGMNDSTLTAVIDIAALEYSSGLNFSYLSGELIDTNLCVAVFEREPQTGDVAEWYGRINTLILDIEANTVEIQASGIQSLFYDLQLSQGRIIGTIPQQTTAHSFQSDTRIGIIEKMCRLAVVQTTGNGNTIAFPSEFPSLDTPTGTRYTYSFIELEMKNAGDALAQYSDNIDVPPFTFQAIVAPDGHLSVRVVEVQPLGVYLSENSVRSTDKFSGSNTESHSAKFINNSLNVNNTDAILFALQQTHPYARGLYSQLSGHESIITLASANDVVNNMPFSTAFSTQITMDEATAKDAGLTVGELIQLNLIIAGTKRYFYGYVPSITYNSDGVVTFKPQGLFTRTPIGFDDIESIKTVQSFLQGVTISDNSVVANIKSLRVKARDNNTARATVN